MRRRIPKEFVIENLMRKLESCDDETYSLFFILYKYELVLFNIEERKKKDDRSLKFIDDTLSWYRALKQKIYSLQLKPESLNLQDYFKQAVPLPLLEKWLYDSPDELIKSLNAMRNEKLKELDEKENELNAKYTERARNWLAWSLLTFKKHTYPVLNASYPAMLGNMFDAIYHLVAARISENQRVRYALMLCGVSLGVFATYQAGFRQSAQSFLLISICQRYAKQYDLMKKVDDYLAIIKPAPRYILHPSVAIRLFMLFFHLIDGLLRKDRVTLFASIAGLFSSVLLVEGMKTWNKDLQISQVDPRDSKALLMQNTQLNLLSVCGFYVFGYLPAIYLAQKYGLFVFCGESAGLRAAVLTSTGGTNVSIQHPLLYYLRPSFWWSNTITTTTTWVSTTGDHLKQDCQCSPNEVMPFDCGPVMKQSQLLTSR